MTSACWVWCRMTQTVMSPNEYVTLSAPEYGKTFHCKLDMQKQWQKWVSLFCYAMHENSLKFNIPINAVLVTSKTVSSRQSIHCYYHNKAKLQPVTARNWSNHWRKLQTCTWTMPNDNKTWSGWWRGTAVKFRSWSVDFPCRTLDLQLMGDHLCG